MLLMMHFDDNLWSFYAWLPSQGERTDGLLQF